MQKTQEMWVLFLGWDDPLGKETETCSSVLAWEIPWTEEPGELQSMRSQRVGHDWAQHDNGNNGDTFHSLFTFHSNKEINIATTFFNDQFGNFVVFLTWGELFLLTNTKAKTVKENMLLSSMWYHEEESPVKSPRRILFLQIDEQRQAGWCAEKPTASDTESRTPELTAQYYLPTSYLLYKGEIISHLSKNNNKSINMDVALNAGSKLEKLPWWPIKNQHLTP